MGFSPGTSPILCVAERLIRSPGCRLFLVHADHSGLELLSSQAVEEELRRARSDPAVALLKEPLPDSTGASSATQNRFWSRLPTLG